MTYKITHKNSTVSGTPPTAGDIDVGEIAINAADAELYTKDANGNIKKFANTDTTGTAAGVQFTQTGTGAVQRTVDSKLKDVVSVKDFGAKGDGVTDDTAAIQAAIAAALANKASVHVPSGEYRLTSQINVNLYDASSYRGIIIYGDGWGSKLVIDHTGTGISLNCSPSFQFFQAQLWSLRFTDGASNPNRFIHNNGAINTLIDGCVFEGATVTTACIVNDNAYGLRCVNSVFTAVVGTGIKYNYASNLSTYSYVNSIERCDFSTITTGVDVQGCNALLVANTVFQECTKGFYANPVAAGVQAFNISFDTCWFERNSSYDIQLSSTASYWCEASIKNCQFAGFDPTYQARIDLGSKSRVTIEGVAAGNTVIVSGSSGASAILIRATNFIQSGSFSWVVIAPAGDITANSFTNSGASISPAGNVTGASFKSTSGVFGGPASGATVTLTTLPIVNDGTWLVTGCLSGTGSAAGSSCVGVVTTQGSSSVYTPIKTATNLTLSASGLNLQGAQNVGAPYSITWTLTRLG
jgi:hypothetical protein